MDDIETILYECKNDGLSITDAKNKINEIIINECESDYRMGFEEGWGEGYEEARYEFE